MKAYRITVKYLDHGSAITFQQIYIAKNFDLAIKHARSVPDNHYIPDSASHAVVESAEQLGSVELIGVKTEPTYEADYQAFAEDLVRWVQQSPFAVIRENKN